jgi:ATP-dependent DNA ligase
MNTIKSSKVMVAKNKAGGKKFWQLHIVQDGAKFYTQTSWYQEMGVGSLSKEQFSEPYYAEPTNVGRANERSSKEQADFEFDSILKKQRDLGFRYENEKASETKKPMLAHKFRDHVDKAVWPSFVQPKLNGIRMLFDGKVGTTRGGKDIIPECIAHLQFNTDGHIMDGELMLPGNQLLQVSMTAIKKFRPELSPQLIYHVYDVVEPEMPYAQRMELVKKLCKNAPPNVHMVQTEVCNSKDEVMGFHKLFTSQGYEGAMLRNPRVGYEDGKRSYSLLKVKSFVDAEFKIVDVIEGGGNAVGTAIFVLEASNGSIFNCRPEGTQESRREMFEARKSLIGKYLSVRYFELSKDGIPIFPVGVTVREKGEF